MKKLKQNDETVQVIFLAPESYKLRWKEAADEMDLTLSKLIRKTLTREWGPDDDEER